MSSKVNKVNNKAQKLNTDKPNLYEVLKSVVMKLHPKDKYCIILFDESAVKSKNVPKSKIVEGEKYPTHVINFMIRGVYNLWKLPISNVFWSRQEADNGSVLGEAIKRIISNVSRTGLSVIASVSDHSKINIAAIDYLTRESNDKNSYIVEFNRVFHVYDQCRLLKSIRNHMMKNDLVYEINGERKTASWKYIRMMFVTDLGRTERKLPNLTVSHICPVSFKKYITKYCVQIFSETLVREMISSINSNELSARAHDTADILLFLDHLFDSCNALMPYSFLTNKPFRCAVSKSSPHFDLWEQAEEILDSMRFVIPDTNKVYRPDSLDKWSYSLNSMKSAVKVLRKYKLKFVPTRIFNLDALTNMMQILKALNDEVSNIYCETTQGDILDQNILRMVLGEDEGYFEIVSL